MAVVLVVEDVWLDGAVELEEMAVVVVRLSIQSWRREEEREKGEEGRN